MRARIVRLLVCLPVLLDPGATARAEEPLVLVVDAARPALRDGLQTSADGTVWITLHDAQHALGLRAKRLIPRPPAGKRPVARRERDDWILCDAEGCTTYGGKLLGTTEEPTFDLARLAAPLRYRMARRGNEIRLRSQTKRVPRVQRRGHLGNVAPDIALPCLDGTVRRLHAHPGRRVLLVTWASWSRTRDLLQSWAAHHQQRVGRKLDLWLAALDVEGADRVKDYVDVGFDTPAAIDRRADLARVLPLRDVGHWFLIDELGLLRADGETLDAVALQWIDLHLDEPIAEPLPAPPAGAPPPGLEALRKDVADHPEAVAPRIALLEVLGAEQRAEAVTVAADLVRLQPRVVAHALRLAALHLDGGDASAALTVLDEARRRVPAAWYLRKQYWALWQPGRFYAGAIDTAWQAEQRKRERAELDHPKRGRSR